MPHRRIPLVKDVMTPFPHFIDVGQSMSAARELMLEHRVRHLPVKEGGELTGVVSERDLEVVAVVSKAAGAERDVPLRELCEKQLYVVDLHAPMDEVVRQMGERRVGTALVVRDGRLAGIITVSDVCRLYGELLTKLAPPEDEPA